LERAIEAASGKDVRLGGGVSTMKQYLRAGLVDDLHFVLSPALIGSGERLFDDLNLPGLGYELTSHLSSPGATHVMVGRRK
jgi:dihydrofolate reductase